MIMIATPEEERLCWDAIRQYTAQRWGVDPGQVEVVVRLRGDHDREKRE